MLRWRNPEPDIQFKFGHACIAAMAVTETSESNDQPESFFRSLREDFVVLTKARLSILVVLTSVFGYFVATKGSGTFSWGILFHLVFGTTLAAFGSAVFNQLMEVDADAKMRRTSDRPLPANRIPKPLAFIIGWLLSAFGLIHLGVKVDIISAAMAAATLLTYLFIYTPLKRISTFNTIVGGVSGALPPLIGWAAGKPEPWISGAVFLFLLLFLWQMPHFAAINWMYRDEYKRGGFVMWSNGDETGKLTAKIAIGFSVLTVLLGALYPLVSSTMQGWGAIPCGLLGAIMLWLSIRFFCSGERADARRLFFYSLLYLPLMMLASYLAWN